MVILIVTWQKLIPRKR